MNAILTLPDKKPRNLPIMAVVFGLAAVCVLAGGAWAWQIKDSRTDKQPDSFLVAQQSTIANGAANSDKSITTLIAVGDIMLSRYVEQKMISKKDWRYPFLQTSDITSKGDIVFGNLESPLISGSIVYTDEMSFRADPQAVAGLTYAGFTVLSLANNHMKNRGDTGISSTITSLDKANILHVGAGLNDIAAREPAIIEKNGVKFGFLAYLDGAFSPASYEATSTRSGSPFLSEATLARDIVKLKTQVDVIIVSMHAGTEYQDVQNQKQASFARKAIDLGAKVVIGHHPHVVEPVEKYLGGYIFYSLGNFIFDQMWSEPTREGAIATITFTGSEPTGIHITPVKIYEYAQPKIIEGEVADAILARMDSFTK